MVPTTTNNQASEAAFCLFVTEAAFCLFAPNAEAQKRPTVKLALSDLTEKVKL